MARSKKDAKRVIKAVNDWNRPRFTEEEIFCKTSLKVNKKKVQEFAAVLTADVFRPLADMLGEHSEKPLVALATGKERLGKVLHLAQSAQRDIGAIESAASNEELFGIQKRLREICSAAVEESVSIINLEGTPFYDGQAELNRIG